MGKHVHAAGDDQTLQWDIDGTPSLGFKTTSPTSEEERQGLLSKQWESTPARAKRMSLNDDTFHDTGYALSRKGCVCGGVLDDVQRRRPHCWSDWCDSFASRQNAMKTVSGATFMLMALFFTTVPLAESARVDTAGAIGVTEFLLANCVFGLLQSLFNPQPLVVIRPTGPVVLVLVQIYQLSARVWPEPVEPEQRAERFFQMLVCTSLFVGLYMGIVAAFELSRFCVHLTRFTLEIFGAFVTSVLIVLGVEQIVLTFQRQRSEGAPFGDPLFSFCLSLLTFGLATAFSNAKRSNVLTPFLRGLVADYALPLSVVITTAVSYLPSESDVRVERIPMPSSFGPTQPGRDWLVSPLASLPRAWGGQGEWYTMLAAAAAAIPVTALFYVDQNIVGLVLQNPQAKLTKGSYYHASFLYVSIANCASPFFGMPFLTGSLPHSPHFARALSMLDSSGRIILSALETRVAPILTYGALGATLLLPGMIELLPDGAANGVLVYIGLSGLLHGNEFFERVVLLASAPSQVPAERPYSRVPWHIMHAYTLLQALCLGVCWFVSIDPTDSGIGLGFPIVILLFIPLRSVLVPRIFHQEHLRILDRD